MVLTVFMLSALTSDWCLLQIGGAQGHMHKMSFAEKQEEVTKDDWMKKLNSHHITRADMNRLIMNYLVTG